MDENWKPLKGYPYFEMNADGLVRSRITRKIYSQWDGVKPDGNDGEAGLTAQSV